ncbi:nucleotidyltransferase domain-containing protein [Desulfitobacterium sp.]|uniref:nucleotidyltransferase domain-containing protein n=1 Tax=Desulfitobacterium sp. TaxID=49981 RepID=UPI002C7717E5|nr:nucleotidyltransferase domain-containing protein [Desulfitobacterium sp.]HVJ49917.1 nucleotidyltransferase domain-containing protein [Desulfitobacterium sp.]
MIAFKNEIESIKQQIEARVKTKKIYLFGSCAKGIARHNSDIDLCVVMETMDKRKSVRELLLTLDYDRDLDIVVYTPEEWDKYYQDTSTFANAIVRTGVKLSG